MLYRLEGGHLQIIRIVQQRASSVRGSNCLYPCEGNQYGRDTSELFQAPSTLLGRLVASNSELILCIYIRSIQTELC